MDNFQLNTIKLAGGIVIKNWGAPTAHVWETGKMGIMQPGRPLSEQADFLMELKPEYLLIKPSHLRLLVSYFYENQLKLSSLKSLDLTASFPLFFSFSALFFLSSSVN